jgi:phosphatidylethanolamine/phosphatidyl-N-methylethanolamine N-methyltransferase
VYDLLYGMGLNAGRQLAMARLAPGRGEAILEVGVGTGLSALAYPPTCHVVAIDVSVPMLARARARLVHRTVRHVRLVRMDAACLGFADRRFDAVYAPYLLNVVSEPLRAVQEMRRVCHPGGRLVFLNHFARRTGREPVLSRTLGRIVERIGRVDWSLDLEAVLGEAGLVPHSVEPVNFAGVSSVVVCRRC